MADGCEQKGLQVSRRLTLAELREGLGTLSSLPIFDQDQVPSCVQKTMLRAPQQEACYLPCKDEVYLLQSQAGAGKCDQKAVYACMKLLKDNMLLIYLDGNVCDGVPVLSSMSPI